MTDTPETGERKTERELEDHPLASPTELAGTADAAIAAEFAARDAEEALDAAEADAAAKDRAHDRDA